MQPQASPLGIDDFVWIFPKEVRVQTVYPIEQVKLIAKKVFDAAKAIEIKDFCVALREMNVEQLDSTFLKFFPELMRLIIYPPETGLTSLAEELSDSLEECPWIFEKLVKERVTLNYLRKETLTYDQKKYLEKEVELQQLKQQLSDSAQKIETWKEDGAEEKWKKELENYLKKEKEYFLKEARLLFFTKFLRENSILETSTEQNKKWSEGISSFTATAGGYAVSYLIRSHLIGNIGISLLSYAGYQTAPLIKREYDHLQQMLFKPKATCLEEWHALELAPLIPGVEITYQFESPSTGLAKLWGTVPNTKGLLNVHIGPWQFQFPFDLTRISPMDEIDLMQLQAIFIKSLNYSILKNEQIHQILSTLREHAPSFINIKDLENYFYLIRFRKKIN